MQLRPRKGVLAIAAVIDIALNARGRPVAAKSLAHRHRLPPRHLEPVLQALVHHGILKGVRGPRGGYELARDRRRISLDEIIGAVPQQEDDAAASSTLIGSVVSPAIAVAERAFSTARAQITMDDVARRAQEIDPSGLDPGGIDRSDTAPRSINFT